MAHYVIFSGDSRDGISLEYIDSMTVLSGGIVTNTTNNDGTIRLEGGTATTTIINDRGGMYVSSGGIANNTTINDLGRLVVSSGGMGNNTIVNSGDVCVRSGGVANSTTVNQYGYMDVSSGGIVNNTTINDLGSMWISSGGTANNTTVYSNGGLKVYYGGTANNATVNSSGWLYIFSKAKMTGQMTFDDRAIISAYDGAIIDFDISCLQPRGGALVNNLSQIFMTSKLNDVLFTLTVSDSQTNGTYTLAKGAAEFDRSITVKDSLDNDIGTLKLGETIKINDVDFTLNLGTDNILSVSVGEPAPGPGPEPKMEFIAKSDIDGNGISDVLFQWTGGNNQTGFWMNGQPEWQSQGRGRSPEWKILGAHDMNGDGKADTVMMGEATIIDMKGTYVGYYSDGVDVDANWHTIGFLIDSGSGAAWQNKVGNLTGNEGMNSIVWYAPDLYALGVWTDSKEEWVSLSASFGGDAWTLVGCGDFDSDGKDSVLMSYNGGQLFYTVGIDGASQALGATDWRGWELRAIGDFAGDGKDDIVLFHKETGSMVMCADGNVDSYASIGQLAADDWFVVGAGDYNGDQKDDLLVRQYSTGMLGYYNTGDTSQWVEMGRGVDMQWTVIA